MLNVVISFSLTLKSFLKPWDERIIDEGKDSSRLPLVSCTILLVAFFYDVCYLVVAFLKASQFS